MARPSLALHLLVALLVVCWAQWLQVEGSHRPVSFREQLLASVPPTPIDNKYRTGFHFQPPNMWMNDPNGPMYYKGYYHLFYQYNPKHAFWESPIWAHSVSKDLINWEALPPAIVPSKPFDIQGCWSGSATVVPGRGPVILYTGNDAQSRQVQNIAFPKDPSDPKLVEWVKPDYNPVIAPVDWINVTQFRDPTTAWYNKKDGHWRLVIGSLRNHTAMAILYRSMDLVHWTKAKHPLHAVANSAMWECPDFYPVAPEGMKHGLDASAPSDKHVLKVSLDKIYFEYYTIGKYLHDKDRYVPDNKTGLRYDYGNFYASKTFFDYKLNRRILMAWSNESDSRSDDTQKGWSGIQIIPRAIWLDKSGRQLVQWPVREIESLRSNEVSLSKQTLKKGSSLEVKGITAAQADVEVTFKLPSLDKAETLDPSWTDPQALCENKGAEGEIGPFGLYTLASSDLRERTAVFFRIFKKSDDKYVALMCQDPTASTLRPGLYKPIYGGFVDVKIKEGGKITLRSLIDHSVVESFGAGGRTCITSRVYPSEALNEDARLFVFNDGAQSVELLRLKAWDMKKPLINGH